MTFTGRIGSADSRLGNIVLGYGSTRGRRFRRPASTPFYRVQVFDLADTTTFGVGDLIAEFENVHALAYADYANSVPEAFFTVRQDDPKAASLRDKGGRAHVRIYRGDDLVWCGWVSLERDANSDDAIFYCYGYLADLFWLHTDWKQTWTSATVGTIVSDLWTRAKTTLTKSRLGHVTTGTIQSPPTTAGGSTAITLATYEAYRKRILFAMQEFAALGASDTGNTTIFEITHSTTPTFNFWSDRSSDLATVRWEFNGSSSGKVQGFREYVMPVYHRNHVYGVGQNPRTAVLQKEATDATDMNEWGRMEEALFFSWVRDETELDRVLKLRKVKALQHDHQITLSFFPGAEVPPNTAQSKWRIGDTVPVLIDRGVSYFNGRQQINGYMVYVEAGQEYVRAIIQEPLA